MIIGLDVGGTHTDIVLLAKDGIIKKIKKHTDQCSLFDTISMCLDEIIQNVDLSLIKRIVFSTTLTTNAIVENKLAKVGLIVTSGPGIDPTHFKIGDNYYCAKGAIDHRGQEIEPISEDEINKISDKLRKAEIKFVGVIGQFSFRNPDHEIKIKKILGSNFKKVFLSHELSGKMNIFRRINTTFINAAVYSLHKMFFEAVHKSLTHKGFNMPIQILKADGGTTFFASSIEHPAETILSGPAASIMGALLFVPEKKDTVVLDIGGTTTDISAFIDKSPLLEPHGIEISGYKTLIRALKTKNLGIGGDSFVYVKDENLQIGPERKGFAMAFNGGDPTVTDAFFVLGDMTNGNKKQAELGIKIIADDLGLSLMETANKIINKACKSILLTIANLINDINDKPVYTIHELRQGYKFSPSHLVLLGGPAKCFAKYFKKLSDYEVSIAENYEVANAVGAALAKTTSEVDLYADTQKGLLSAPKENFFENIDQNFTKENAIEKALELLKQKAIKKGAKSKEIEMEILDAMEFNMVRGFYTQGKDIRVRAQIKPGHIENID